MTNLRENGIQFQPDLENCSLSPSFYIPSNLLLITGQAYLELAAQLNSIEAWTLLPQYELRCHEYFEYPRAKRDYLLFTKALLQRGNVSQAKDLLSKTLVFKWSETHR